MNRRRVNHSLLAAGAALLMLALAGCSSAEPLAEQYRSGAGQGYISGDGAYTELPPEARGAAIDFEGTDEQGRTVSSDDFAGQVYVVNFWYAGCPPCRLEAADLVALDQEYEQVPFLGVNIFDGPEVAAAFAREFGVEYPSILDADTATVQLAFAGQVAPNAVPTTLVMDRDGRVAGRISGLLRDKSILAAMLDTVLEEG